MSINPLLDLFISSFTDPTIADLEGFMASAVNDAGNFELFDEGTGATISSNRSIFYSGNVAGAFGGNIATDLAHRASEPTRVIDDTKIGRFFGSISIGGALDSVIVGESADVIRGSVPWSGASKQFADTAKGTVTILLGDTASKRRVGETHVFLEHVAFNQLHSLRL